MRVAARLGQTCRQRRLTAGLRQIDVSTHAGVAETTITHFEQGRWWVRETDAIVDAYAELLGTTSRVLWQEALDMDCD